MPYNFYKKPKFQFCHLVFLIFKRTQSTHNFEAEKMSKRNFNISQMLNPMRDLFMDMKRALNLLQLI